MNEKNKSRNVPKWTEKFNLPDEFIEILKNPDLISEKFFENFGFIKNKKGHYQVGDFTRMGALYAEKATVSGIEDIRSFTELGALCCTILILKARKKMLNQKPEKENLLKRTFTFPCVHSAQPIHFFVKMENMRKFFRKSLKKFEDSLTKMKLEIRNETAKAFPNEEFFRDYSTVFFNAQQHAKTAGSAG